LCAQVKVRAGSRYGNPGAADDGRARLAVPSDAPRLTAWRASSFMAQINLHGAAGAAALVKQA
jgi:hypothetical protein